MIDFRTILIIGFYFINSFSNVAIEDKDFAEYIPKFLRKSPYEIYMQEIRDNSLK